MSLDYSTIIQVRQRFGDSEVDPFFETNEEPEAPFVGSQKDYSFDCPNLNNSESAILMFQSMGVSHRKNQIVLNDNHLFGGLYTSIDRDSFVTQVPSEPLPPVAFTFNQQRWNANILLVSGAWLRKIDNRLHIESRNAEGGTGGNLDNFIIDNMVILFKTKVNTGIISPIR